mmetsp:Transcript_67035/g.200261  ORF Transcript_67035/g.200261 Transcript_67035/m.200261 type:complete len:91 (+) Transcript_67035:701-973(+)
MTVTPAEEKKVVEASAVASSVERVEVAEVASAWEECVTEKDIRTEAEATVTVTAVVATLSLVAMAEAIESIWVLVTLATSPESSIVPVLL